MSEVDSMVPAVYRHEKRREWGLGVLAWERNQRRAYLFQDGQLRIVAKEYYSLLREVDRPHAEVEALVEQLRPELEAIHGKAARPRTASTGLPFETQVAVFREEFPGAFSDPTWLAELRGEGAPKRLKRHRNPAIEDAQAKLSEYAIEGHMSQHQFRSVWSDAMLVLRETDLVPAGQLVGLETDDAERIRALAKAVRELVHGSSASHSVRFERFLTTFQEAFGKAPSWQLATALPALVHPADHICVRPSSMAEQAKSLAPRLAGSRSPTSAGYARYLSMAKLVAEKLSGEGAEPRDLMDVYDFIRLSTRPAAKKLAITLKSPA